MDDEYTQGYGGQVNMSQYFDPQSDKVRNLSWTAQFAGSWKRIEVPECLSQYVYCSARTEYRDVVMVVRSHEPSYSFSPNASLECSPEKCARSSVGRRGRVLGSAYLRGPEQLTMFLSKLQHKCCS